MRKFLQSKIAVSLMVIVAVLAVGANFVSLPKGINLAAARQATENALESAEMPANLPPVSRLTAEQKEWRALFPLNPNVRDPFAPPVDLTPRAPTQATAFVAPAAPLLSLQAISHEAGRAFAVINQQVLTEGEAVLGYTVEKILPSSVKMRGLLGSLSLTLQPGAPRQKAATAKPAAADLSAAAPGPSPAGTPR